MRSHKRNQYYQKDKKVKIIKATKTVNALGQMSNGYQYITNQSLWAYADQLSQTQVFNAKAYGDEESYFFVLNYREDLTIYHYIEYKGKYYNITRIDTSDDYKTDLFIYAKDTPKGELPHDIKPATD